MDRAAEFKIKTSRLAEYLHKAGADGADGVALCRVDNFAWITCGGESHVNAASECGVATFLMVGDSRIVLTNRIEEARIFEEQLAGLPVEIDSLPWQADREQYIKQKYCSQCVMLSDVPLVGMKTLSSDFEQIMMELTPSELDRYRDLGGLTGEALQDACKQVKNGMTENQLAGLLARNCVDNGVFPVVILVAADERLRRHRHPLPTSNKIEKDVMAVVCGRKGGLIASCTRMVSIGGPSPELRRRHDACLRVDAAFNTLTRPGESAGRIYSEAIKIYDEAGFPGEWDLHHQGGATSYRSRWFFASEDSPQIVAQNTAYAWNPSITGTKSEDTILILRDYNEFITVVPGWPLAKVEAPGATLERPDILSI